MVSPLDKFYAARVTYRHDVAPDLWILRLDPGGEFKFLPGQYATLGASVLGARIERPYSIASSAYEKELELFLELVTGDGLTPVLHEAQVGAEFSLRKSAKGRFTLDLASAHRKHLLLCTVTGVAPYVSYVRTLYADWRANRFAGDLHLYLVQGASRSWEFGYREELEGTAAEVPWLTYVPTISRPAEDTSWPGEKGRVDDIIRRYIDTWHLTPADTTVYLCGNPKMVENGMRILECVGFPKAGMKGEVYWVPKDTALRSSSG